MLFFSKRTLNHTKKIMICIFLITLQTIHSTQIPTLTKNTHLQELQEPEVYLKNINRPFLIYIEQAPLIQAQFWFRKDQLLTSSLHDFLTLVWVNDIGQGFKVNLNNLKFENDPNQVNYFDQYSAQPMYTFGEIDVGTDSVIDFSFWTLCKLKISFDSVDDRSKVLLDISLNDMEAPILSLERVFDNIHENFKMIMSVSSNGVYDDVCSR
jgi:hypothetical protein